MRKIFLLAAIYALLSANAVAQQTTITDTYVQGQIAKGRLYTLVELLPGPKRVKVEAEEKALVAAHARYLFQLKMDKKLATAGPVLNDGKLDGIYIFNTAKQEDVKKWLDVDPAISKGHFTYRMYTWFSIPGDELGQQE
ncbi:MAG: hypothetical protein EOP56_08065 [Sphingobacteriales bacterium]|nr:MAG: hypothetical protein EOP56_08065 [Sphingobacteriales bacterium]